MHFTPGLPACGAQKKPLGFTSGFCREASKAIKRIKSIVPRPSVVEVGTARAPGLFDGRNLGKRA